MRGRTPVVGNVADSVHASHATGAQSHDWVDYVTAFGTLGAALAALLAVAVAITIQRRTLRAEGRRQAAFDISVWLQEAVDLLKMWHDPAGYRLVRMSPVEREHATDEQVPPGVDVLEDMILKEDEAEAKRRPSWLGELRLRAHLFFDEARWRMMSRSHRADADSWDPASLDPDDADVFAVPYSHARWLPALMPSLLSSAPSAAGRASPSALATRLQVSSTTLSKRSSEPRIMVRLAPTPTVQRTM
jgi:hypothetical protein